MDCLKDMAMVGDEERPSYTLRDWGDRKDKAKALHAGIYVNSITLKPEAEKCGGRALFKSGKRSSETTFAECHWRATTKPNRSLRFPSC
ncbi:hypothetical protein CEXT_759511 [Caerostris extrusa]|uniref:Uncharacterized protein n=1 Tax=Caerostris extrusa TaxID=172846 RepID=A0AAV4MDI6_CAEEX|nr:hypothetical protein CEXT_759511 [Caerostris extrusa]